jgi:hypothetical protein
MGSRLHILARVWHVLGIGYFTILLVVSQVDPTNALPFMARATAQTLLVIGVGSLLILLLNTVLAKPIRLPDDLRKRLPLLEARVNAYVPATFASCWCCWSWTRGALSTCPAGWPRMPAAPPSG